MLAWAVAHNLSIGHLLRFRYGLEDPLSPFVKIIENHKDLLEYSLRPEKKRRSGSQTKQDGKRPVHPCSLRPHLDPVFLVGARLVRPKLAPLDF